MKYIILKITLGVLLFSLPLLAYKEISVDLYQQKIYAMEDGNIIFQGTISSGMIDRDTPEGVYKILQKKDTIAQTCGLNQMVEQRCPTC